MDKEIRQVNISVRELVEFILRSGDIDSRSSHVDPDAMLEGGRLHRKIQKRQDSGYRAEVPLSLEVHELYDDEQMLFVIDGRADGIFERYAEPEEVKAADRRAEEQKAEEQKAEEQKAAEQKAEEQKAEEQKAEEQKAEEQKAAEQKAEEQKAAEETLTEKNKDNLYVYIDEIKTTYGDVLHMEAPVSVHLAQAKCYAFIHALLNGLDYIGVQMTYCNIDSEQLRYFRELYSFEEIEKWFYGLTHEYAKWISRQLKWERSRNRSIKNVEFPFSYRPGQRDLVAGVYRTILRSKKLFLEAPTGVGKTISTVFPAVRAMGEGHTSKIFYGTAKTIARTVAEEAFRILAERGAKLKTVTITAKEKICILEKPSCNPVDCPRAKGHLDRVNDCVYDLLTHEGGISRELILKYAEKHNVCPFEMCLDVTTWSDAVICDYNYLFDPNVYLHRFFAEGVKKDYVFLVDEAHNLVERAREMYSAVLVKEKFLEVKRMVGNSDANHTRLSTAIERCNKALLQIKRQCEDFAVWEDADNLYNSLLNLMGVYEGMPRSFSVPDQELLSELYLEIRHFVNMYDGMDNDYTIYSDYNQGGDFCLHLQCMDPSRNLKKCLEKGRSTTFFSATLLPVKYYVEQLGGNNTEDYAVYAPSPFPKKNRIIMIARDVSTKYTRRSTEEYKKIADYIKNFADAKTGNYMAFFPSYKMMKDISEVLLSMYTEIFLQNQENDATDNNDTENVLKAVDGKETGRKISLLLQKQSMTEEDKESFLNYFDGGQQETRIGFCVMGGIFGEGIDLRADRLIGAVIVGTGLPQVCNERELFRNYFDERNHSGFEYAYLYNGMNKVLQSAGRVIRTDEDRGAILLLDERFGTKQYTNLFPMEWHPNEYVTCDSMRLKLEQFWASVH